MLKRYLIWFIASIFIFEALLYCYNKLNTDKQASCPVFYAAKEASIVNGYSFVLIDAPDWCKDCVALHELYLANYQQNINFTINAIGGFHIKLKSYNCEKDPAEVSDLLNKCEIRNVPSLIVFKDDTFTVKTDISEIATTIFSATQSYSKENLAQE
jgi:thiol-disulfide isomerase/thioredoxin